ncbi:hypothetical protein TNIN_222661 [Trichonephila inaurata madagascariensis]|uniref:Uncharacterized protein n=1 Tax=Trichonephila inaurata madagascariensis TaxID=2747483 RepID=A0A8X6YLB6_9ARAC|nr:hypothetical protein TNIN_222661 [Trichonephila inaurata madagascariensis]
MFIHGGPSGLWGGCRDPLDPPNPLAPKLYSRRPVRNDGMLGAQSDPRGRRRPVGCFDPQGKKPPFGDNVCPSYPGITTRFHWHAAILDYRKFTSYLLPIDGSGSLQDLRG